MEERKRSIIKGLTWRFTGTVDTIVVSYFITGSLRVATSIGVIEVMTKLGLYYLHERIWLKVAWGRAQIK